MKKKTIIWIAVIGVVIIGAVFFSSREKDVPVETYSVTRTDINQTVSATGELKAESEISLNFETGGRVELVRIAAGDTVAAGDTLSSIEADSLNDELSNAKAALDKAIAQAGISDDEISRLEGLEDNAEQFLEDTRKLENQRMDAAEQDVDDTERSYKDALEYYQQVVAENGESSATAKSAKLTVNTALRSFNGAKETEETTKKSRNLAITAAENSLKSAKDNLSKAKSSHQSLFDDAGVAAARSQYEISLHNLEKATLKAPSSGTITKVNFKKGEVLGTALTTPFARMVSKDLLIEANIAESDIAKIKVGNKGTVTFDAFGDDEEFGIELVSIEPASTVIQDVVYYIVSFTLSSANDIRLRPGMTANLNIETNRKAGVIAIPERLIQEEGNAKFVEIQQGEGQVKRVDVKTGMRGDGGMIEILSGLKEGDQVVAGSVE